jgi:alkaline phosphatase
MLNNKCHFSCFFQVIFGGGYFHFVSNGTNSTIIGKRRDGRDLVQDWVKNRFGEGITKHSVARNANELKKAVENKSTHILGLFNDDHMTYTADVKPNSQEPDLKSMTLAAIETLENEQGFVLMVGKLICDPSMRPIMKNHFVHA